MANSYILAQKGKFFHRFINGEFVTKWTGFWDHYKKYLEYFAIKIDDDWLSKNTQTGFLHGLNYVVHYYETRDYIVEEKISLTDALKILLKISTKKFSTNPKSFRILFEFAVNFRNFDEDIVDKNYRVEYSENCAQITDGERNLIFKSNKKGIFIGTESYKIHYPSNQAFKCFLPKNFVIYDFIDDNYLVNFYFFIEKESVKKRNYNKFLSKNLLETELEFVNELYKIALLNLESCYDGKTFVGGYPWYAYYWSRDTAFSIIGASLTSMQKYARNSLIFFFKYFDDKFPNFILGDKIFYNSKDSLPLFIIALSEYLKNSGDLEILKILKHKIIKTFEWYRKNSSEHGFVYSGSDETWMDTINREGYNLEIQVFWYSALKNLSKIFKILNFFELSNLARIYSERLKENILENFLTDGVFIDNLKTKKITINSIFPFVFGLTNDKNIFENIEKHLKEKYGFYSLSKYSEEFNEFEYHKGASWYHLNALVAYVYFKFGDFDEGLKLLKTLYELKDAYCKNSLIEVYNAKTRDILVKKPIGLEETSYLQAWSAANVIFAIQKGLLGVDVNVLTSSIFLSPYVNFSLVKRVDNDFIKLNYFNKNLSYNSLKRKKYKIVFKYI